MKLNLGCFTNYMDGYLNVDIDPFHKVDLISDFSFTLPFKTESIDEVYSSHLLEHLTKPHAIVHLKDIKRVLKAGGILHIKIPDMRKVALRYAGGDGRIAGDHKLIKAIFLHGESKFNSHKYGYTLKTLLDLLIRLGYKIVNDNCDTRTPYESGAIAMK